MYIHVWHSCLLMFKTIRRLFWHNNSNGWKQSWVPIGDKVLVLCLPSNMAIISEKPFYRHFHLFCWYYWFNIVISFQNGTKATALEKSSREDFIVWLVLFTDMFASLLSRVPQRTEYLLFISTSPNILMRKSVKKPLLDSVSAFTPVRLGFWRGDFCFFLN